MTAAPLQLGATLDGEPLAVDLDRLIGGHACVVANSGGGKSGAVRRLLEVTDGRVQRIVLDVEDEFYTLREKFDFVIAGGDGADAPATVAGAAALARATLENGFSLVVQLNDLGADAPAFVGAFLEALIHAPRALWRPLLVVLDEAHRFAPQDGRTAASAGVKALTGQGRKRGFTAVLASQRLAKIDADVRGDVNNWLFGRVGQALDRDTMANALGFSAAEGRKQLRGMAPREFWAFGPAIADEPVLFRVADVETTPVRPGQAKLPTPPPPEALRAILAGLASAATETEEAEEARRVVDEAGDVLADILRDRNATIDALQKINAQLKREVEETERMRRLAVATGKRATDALSSFTNQAIELAQRGTQLLDDVAQNGWRSLIDSDTARADQTPAAVAGVAEGVDIGASSALPSDGRVGSDARHEHPGEAAAGGEPSPSPSAATGAIRGRKALLALWTYSPIGLDEQRWAFRAGLSLRGGTWSTYRGALQRAGLVEQAGDRWRVKQAGADAARESGDDADLPYFGPELARAWAKRVPSAPKLVEILLKRWPHFTTRDALAADAGMSAGGGTFSTYLGRLRAARLIEEQGKRLRLSPALMEEA